MTRREHAGTTVFNADATPFDQLPLVTYDPAGQTLTVTRGQFDILTLTRHELTQLADGPGEPHAVFTNRRGERRLVKDGARVPLNADYTLYATFPHRDIALPVGPDDQHLSDYADRIRIHAAAPASYPHGCTFGDKCAHAIYGLMLAEYYDNLHADGWEINHDGDQYVLLDVRTARTPGRGNFTFRTARR